MSIVLILIYKYFFGYIKGINLMGLMFTGSSKTSRLYSMEEYFSTILLILVILRPRKLVIWING